jgi:hypothetical protein
VDIPRRDGSAKLAELERSAGSGDEARQSERAAFGEHG